jgi:hypothetical protein
MERVSTASFASDDFRARETAWPASSKDPAPASFARWSSEMRRPDVGPLPEAWKASVRPATKSKLHSASYRENSGESFVTSVFNHPSTYSYFDVVVVVALAPTLANVPATMRGNTTVASA